MNRKPTARRASKSPRASSRTDVKLSTAIPRPGYIFYAAEGTKVTLETTHAGSPNGLDTQLKVYGPRLSDGSYPKTLATDDDSGYGKLARVKDLEISIPGFYLVEVTSPAPIDATTRLKLSCTGTCDSDLPVAPLGNDIKWYQRAAERKALSLQAYALATKKLVAPTTGSWGVVFDIDETTLDNSNYQKSRADLGSAIHRDVDRLGQREGGEPDSRRPSVHGAREIPRRQDHPDLEPHGRDPQTRENLAANNITFDVMLCKTTTSDKNPRFDAVKMGMAGIPATNIVMYVGDNILDFPGLSQDIRKMPDTAFASFGETNILIPNPMYGSWEKNVD